MTLIFRNWTTFWDIPKWNRGQTKWDGGSINLPNSHLPLEPLIVNYILSKKKSLAYLPMHTPIILQQDQGGTKIQSKNYLDLAYLPIYMFQSTSAYSNTANSPKNQMSI